MPDGFQVASAWVKVSPDLTTFEDDLKAKLAGTGEELRIPATLETAGIMASAEKARDEVKDQPPAKIPSMLDTSGVLTDAEKARQEVQDEPPAKIPVKADPDDLDKVKKDTDKAAQDAGDSGGGLMAAAISAGLVAGGPLVAGALAGVGIVGLTALGVELQKDNPEIQAGWAKLSSDATAAGKQASQGIVGPVVSAMSTIDSAVKAETPVFQQMFTGAAADIPVLADGLVQLADNALPGVNAALHNSSAIAGGFGSVLGDVGTMTGNLGQTVSSNASTIGSDVGQIGSTVKILGGAVDDVITTTSHLAQGALPGLNGVLSTTEEGLHAVTSAASAIGAPLGAIGSSILTGFVASKTLGTGLDTLGGKLVSAGEKLTTSDSQFSLYGASVSTAGSGLQSVAGAIPFVAAGVSMLSSVVTEAYGDQSEFTTAVQQGGDAFTQATDKAASLGGTMKSVTGQGLTLGGMFGGFWDQITGQGVPSLSSMYNQLDAVGKAQYALNAAIQQYGATSPQALEAQNKLGDSYDEQGNLTQSIATYQSAYNAAVADFGPTSSEAATASYNLGTATEQQAAQTALSNSAMSEAAAQTATWTADLGVLASKTDSVSQQVTALNSNLDIATHGNLSYSQAMETANADLLSMAQLVASNTDGLRGHAAALLDDTGLVNSSTAAGQALNQQLLTAVTGFENVTVAAHDHALAVGQSDTQAVAAATAAGASFASNLDSQLSKLGLNQAAIQKINTAYGLTPKDVATEFQTPGLPAAQAAVDKYNTALNTAAEPRSTVFSLYEKIIGPGPSTAGPQSLAGLLGVGHAEGGIDIPAMAGGGVLGALPSMAPIASVVPPNAPRVIGDNTQVPEAFIPWNGSSRAQSIWQQTGAANGWTRNAVPTPAPITNYNNTFNITGSDAALVAQQVMAEQQWIEMSARAL